MRTGSTSTCARRATDSTTRTTAHRRRLRPQAGQAVPQRRAGIQDHPAEFNAKNGYLDDYEVRKFAYWAVFAGVCGHTYGCHDIWEFIRRPAPRSPSREPLAPGFALSRNRANEVSAYPDRSCPMLSASPTRPYRWRRGRGNDRIEATRRRWFMRWFIRLPADHFDRPWPSGSRIQSWWLDPRTGMVSQGHSPRQGVREFRPPSQGKGQDWVLVLDDASRAYPAPEAGPQ